MSPVFDLQFQARLNWLSEKTFLVGRGYSLASSAISDGKLPVTAVRIKQILQTSQLPGRSRLNQLFPGDSAIIEFSSPSVFPQAGVYESAPFVVLDSQSNESLGEGVIEFVLRRSTNIRWQNLTINKQARAFAKQQQPCCIWFTGLSGAGKSTIANLLEKKLYDSGCHTYLLDGDNLRHGLNRDLGFTEADRIENIRRVAEVAKLMVDAGLIVIASFISPFKADRQLARALFENDEFIEVFVDTPLVECERRDVKGLYAKARRGELKNFTGIDSGYEPPENPELCVQTTVQTPEQCVEQLVQYLVTQNILLKKIVE